MNSPGCPFCDVVARRSPARIVYEDEDTIAFFPLEPEVLGHTLILPKEHFADVFETPPSVLNAVMATLSCLSTVYRTRLKAAGVNILHASGVAAQQSVPHVHFHLLPRFAGDGLNTWPSLPPHAANYDELLKLLRHAPAHDDSA